MKNYLLTIDRKILNVIRIIGQEAERKKMSAYVVGGIVRDMIIGEKNLDLDIVVEGDAVLLAETLAGKWKIRATIHRQFKTASFKTPGGLQIDFATARQEFYVHAGALPTVQRGSLKEDLFRRDFTVNAMAIAINPDRFGQLIDAFGGWKDLSAGKIRILHAQSFIDDPTRILRAVRFEQRFGFQIERNTLILAKNALAQNALMTIKPARYFSELKKILSEPDPLKYLKRLRDLNALKFIEAQLVADFQNFGRLCGRIRAVRRKLPYKTMDFWLVYFIGLIAGSDRAAIERILARFPWTKMERASIRQSLDADDPMKKLSVKSLKPSQVYRVLRPMTTDAVLYLRVRTSQREIGRRMDRFLTKDKDVKLSVNGEDLKRLGIGTGTQMGKILENVLYLKIDQRVRTKREELDAASLS